MLYSDNKPVVVEALKSYMSAYEKINNSNIERYEILGNGVTKSIFANGVSVYANHTNEKIQSPVGDLEPYQFVVGN